MKILFVTVAWPQEGNRNLYSDLLHEFILNEHEVFVACADEKTDSAQLKIEDGIQVLRIPTKKIQKASKFKKALSLPFLGFKFKRHINNYFSDCEIDLIICNTPPITLSGLMIYLKKKYKAFFYLLLKDIWPHSSASLSLIKENGLIYKYFRWHEKRMYREADVIGCMSPKNVEYILNNNPYLDKGKVEECPNSIMPRILEQERRSEIRLKYGIPEDATVFIFSGNLSIGHGLQFYISAIAKLNDYEKAFFLIGGSGTHFDFLREAISEYQLKNVFLYKWLPKEDFEQILLASDVGVILLRSEYTVPQFPSRLLAYLEASKPVMCVVNQETDIGSICVEAGCGISIHHGDLKTFSREIKRLAEDEVLRTNLGLNSRKLLESRYTTKNSYSIIMRHFNDESHFPLTESTAVVGNIE